MLFLSLGRVLNGLYYNFWQDETHVRGIWRRCTLEEYRKPDPAWETVLDIDALNEEEGESWVWGGSTGNSFFELTHLSHVGVGRIHRKQMPSLFVVNWPISPICDSPFSLHLPCPSFSPRRGCGCDA